MATQRVWDGLIYPRGPLSPRLQQASKPAGGSDALARGLCASMEAGGVISWPRNYADKRHPGRDMYLGTEQRPVTPDPSVDLFSSWIRHKPGFCI